MINYKTRSAVLIVVSIMLAVLTGCTRSKPSRFYTLHSVIPDTGTEVAKSVNAEQNSKKTLRIIDVVIPDYIDRNVIVTRISDSEVKLNEYSRWAGDIAGEIRNTITLDLMKLRPDLEIVNYNIGESRYSYGMVVKIDELIADKDGNVYLSAHYWISIDKNDGKAHYIRKQVSFKKRVKASDHDAIVSAMSELLGELSVDIAKSLS